MKTAKVLPPETPSSSSRRSQRVRQTRTDLTRAMASSSRGGRDSLAGANATEQPINIFPGITYFVDAITALPKELVRHFTLLKEVDAKIFAPEATLFHLIDLAIVDPPPVPSDPDPPLDIDAASNIAPSSTSFAVNVSSTKPQSDQPSKNGHAPFQPPAEIPCTNVFHPLNLPRRQLFRQTAIKIQEMLVSLEEKNHVISTANDALQKHLGRINEIWPYLENEFSVEAKWGSDVHWAYPENRAARAANTQAEKTRREGAANLSAAALMIAEEVAARSDARKQAVSAKKSHKNLPLPDSELDDHQDGKGKDGTGKKTMTKRKNAAGLTAPTDSPSSIGLGISNPLGTNGTPAPKRRKVEKSANGEPAAERPISAAASNAKESKAKASASPRATPAPEQPPPNKRKALPNSTGQGKKRVAAAVSPPVVSSPIVTALPDTVKAPLASPAPSTTRPASARARQNSTASTADNARQRPASAASNKANGCVATPMEIAYKNSGCGAGEFPRITQMEPPSATVKVEATKLQNDRAPTPPPASASAAGRKKEGSAKPMDESEKRKEAKLSPSAPTVPQATTTKNCRGSKPSTPAISSFPEGVSFNNGRCRPSRASEAHAIPKRSHKKGASAAHAAAVQKALTQQQKGSGGEPAAVQEDDMDLDDPNEELYCYCNQVSFGEMVGCDGDKCKIEWFHLSCVGLRSAPPKNMKWYCDECKKQNGKKVNGR